MTKKIIDSRTFVRAWMEQKTVSEVAAALKTSNGAVSAKASALRAKGVKLPTKRLYEVADTVNELNELIDTYLNPHQPQGIEIAELDNLMEVAPLTQTVIGKYARKELDD